MDTEKHTQLLLQVAKQFFTEDILDLIENMVAVENAVDGRVYLKPRVDLMHLMKDYAQQYLAQQDLQEAEQKQQLYELFKLLNDELNVIERQVSEKFYEDRRSKEKFRRQ